VALLAEELVEEWLNRQGYFTIRGVKIGVDEIDLLAVRFSNAGDIEYRHIEVQASMRPVSYISRVPKKVQKQGKAPNSASRTQEELLTGVEEWVEKKFTRPRKVKLMESLAPTEWSSELIINNVKSQEEVEMIRGHGITVHQLSKVVSDLQDLEFKIKSAAGADFVDLVSMGGDRT